MSLGVMFRREWAPEGLIGFAQRAETAGLEELWLVEDLAYHGGFAQAGAALASTQRLTVGLGIAPAVARNVGYAAMEVATLARIFPGRFHMGFGHGVADWIDQVGATPASWLASLREVADTTRRLVGGQEVTVAGQHVRVRALQLVHPATTLPSVSLGVRRPKSMAVAAETADGVILAEGSGPRYVEEVRTLIGPAHRLTVFVHASADVDGITALTADQMADPRVNVQLAAYADELPPLTDLMIAGPADTWPAQARRWLSAGADSVVYCPLPTDPVGLDLTGAAE
jgi:5,10-methylenetetrahydromethanopterin reductase